jgi:hypothetical protein
MAYGTVNVDAMTTSDGVTSAGTYGFKNRIINGAMVIDQRNAGASLLATNTSVSVYTVDRWAYSVSQASKITYQQNAGSVTPPVGFSNYLGVSVSATATVGSTDYFYTWQAIEGFNSADLNWGTANAKTVTLSFWVYSNLTGTFGGSIINASNNLAYPFTYTISAATTWQQITVTVVGPTTGTWTGATNGTGMRVCFGLGVGSTNSGTAGSWSSGYYVSATGATSILGSTSNYWYITGVQLEKGSTATSFDYRPYGTELQLCQRYFQTITQGTGQVMGFFVDFTTTALVCSYVLGVQMRATPSYISTLTSYRQNGRLVDANSTNTPVLTKASLNNGRLDLDGFSGLTSGDSGVLVTNSAGYTALTSEL